MSYSHVGAGAFAAIVAVSQVAEAEPFTPFLGTWGGAGRVVVQGGKSEQIKCNGYFRADGQKGLSVAIRCASVSYSIQLRSVLALSGSLLSGSWEERSLNLQGRLSGRLDGGHMALNVDGDSLKAAMTISVSGMSQSVVLSTQGAGLKEVRMALFRSR